MKRNDGLPTLHGQGLTASDDHRCSTTTVTLSRENLRKHGDGIILSISQLEQLATASATVRNVIPIVDHLSDDEYTQYTIELYRAGLERYGDDWHYADIVTTLFAAGTLIQPQRYLEIGVRQGRSLIAVASVAPQCSIVGFDMWVDNYSSAPNPGPSFVEDKLRKVKFSGRVEFVSGDSHKTLPEYFRAHQNVFFDLVAVDGDHSRDGAARDILDVLPHIAIGGVIVFDDIVHPVHPYLNEVWMHCIPREPLFSSWSYTELGFGVAAAIRKG